MKMSSQVQMQTWMRNISPERTRYVATARTHIISARRITHNVDRINMDDGQAYEENSQNIDELMKVISSGVPRLIQNALLPGNVEGTKNRNEVHYSLLVEVRFQRWGEEITEIVRRGDVEKIVEQIAPLRMLKCHIISPLLSLARRRVEWTALVSQLAALSATSDALGLLLIEL